MSSSSPQHANSEGEPRSLFVTWKKKKIYKEEEEEECETREDDDPCVGVAVAAPLTQQRIPWRRCKAWRFEWRQTWLALENHASSVSSAAGRYENLMSGPVLSEYGKSIDRKTESMNVRAISYILAARSGCGLDVGGDAVQDLHDDGDGDADEEHEHEAVEEEARDEVHDAQGDDAAHQLLAVDVLHVLRPVELLHRPPGLHCGSCVVALTRHRN